MNDRLVLIAGAGPTGLALGYWLTKLGVRVRIIDKAAEAGTTSRAVAVQARTLELYRQAGLSDAVIDAGVRVQAVNLWAGGSKVAQAPLSNFGDGLSPFPFALTYAQDEHERYLIERLNELGVTVERRTELVRFHQGAECVTAVIRGQNGADETVSADYLAGCDGAHSTVREALQVGFQGAAYSGIFYVADVEAEGPAANNEIHVDLEEADFLAVFPLKGLGRARLVGPVSSQPDVQGGETSSDDVSERANRNLKLIVSKMKDYSTYHVHHRVAEHFRDKRVFLLGDAAHVHSPVGGQGMNTGIGDAVNLSWKLAAILNNWGDERLLDTYEPERMAFARRLVATTDRAFTIVTKQGGIARWVRTSIVPRILPMLLRMRWVQRIMFRTVSQIGVNYRNSWLSEGHAGGVRSGDRLPWVQFDNARDNFEPLSSLQWQVHVYGESGEDLRPACGKLGLPLHRFDWLQGMNKRGISRGCLYLVRPDGYIALADPRADPGRLKQYLCDHGIELPY